MSKTQVEVHFYLPGSYDAFRKQVLNFVPSRGDNIRIDRDFFTVIEVNWPLDETDYRYSRCNLQVELE